MDSSLIIIAMRFIKLLKNLNEIRPYSKTEDQLLCWFFLFLCRKLGVFCVVVVGLFKGTHTQNEHKIEITLTFYIILQEKGDLSF